MSPWKTPRTLQLMAHAGILCALLSCGHIRLGREWHRDTDGDGYSDGGRLCQVEQPPGCFLKEELLALQGDCSDSDATVYPGAVEVCDGKDNDCNGRIDDGPGEMCRHFQESIQIAAPEPVRPGEPLWVTAAFTNDSGKPIQTIRPDCFNTTFTLQDEAGRVLPPLYRMRKAYGIPEDVVTIHPGSFTVSCDLAEMFRADVLTSGSRSRPAVYRLQATYANFIQDPDIDKSGHCTEPKGECYHLWTGAVASSSRSSVVIAGDPMERLDADVSFKPAFWVAQWALGKDVRIRATIRIVDAAAIDPAWIRLNGRVGVLSVVSSEAGEDLKVEFDASEALKSLGAPIPPIPGVVYPVVDIVTPRAVFTGKAAVQITTFDLNGDGRVNEGDLPVLRESMGRCAGKPGYLPAADYDGSGCVDGKDLGTWRRENPTEISTR